MDRPSTVVSFWQRGIWIEGYDLESGPAYQLFEASIAAFSSLLRIISADPSRFESESYGILREEFRKFFMWHEGFSTRSGELDSILSCSRNLRATVLRLMVDWVNALIKVPKVMSDYDWSSGLAAFADLQILNEKSCQIAKAAMVDMQSHCSVIDSLHPESDSDSDSDVESTASDYTFEGIVEDLHTYMESLINLSPSLDHPATDNVFIEHTNPTIVADLSSVAEPARAFVLIIRDRFPSIDADLVRKLGEANWLRRERLQKKFAEALNVEGGTSTADDDSSIGGTIVGGNRQATQNQLDTTSTIRSSISLSNTFQSTTMASEFSAPSIFDNPSISNPFTRSSFVESVTSFATSIGDGIGHGQRRIPNLPEGHVYGLPFQCQICGDMLTGVRNWSDWRKHVYNDLEPYICLFPDCNLGLHTFQSRREWKNHEFQAHRVFEEWSCSFCKETFTNLQPFQIHFDIMHANDVDKLQVAEFLSASKKLSPCVIEDELCPFCMTAPAQSQEGFARHVGKHQQEISLAALPRLDKDSDNESTSDDQDVDSDDSDADGDDHIGEGTTIFSDVTIPNRTSINSLQSGRSIRSISQSYLDESHSNEKISDEVEQKQALYLERRRSQINDLIHTEALYLKDLNIIEEIYKGTAIACPKLDQNDIKIIFRNIHQIVALSTIFLNELKAASASLSFPPGEGEWQKRSIIVPASTSSDIRDSDIENDRKTFIGLTFGLHLTEMQDVYTEFLTNSVKASSHLTKIRSDPAVKVWLDECNHVAKDLSSTSDIDALLIKPVQRITMYPLILHDILNYTTQEHPDFEALQSAHNRFGDLLKNIDGLIQRTNTVGKILGAAREQKESDIRIGLTRAFGRRNRSATADSNRPPEDDEYAKLHNSWANHFIQLQIITRDVGNYTRDTEAWTKDVLRYFSSIELFMRVRASPYPELESKWARFNFSMNDIRSLALQTHISDIQAQVIEPLEEIIKIYTATTVTMENRTRRRLDYEKFLALKTANKKIDKKLTENVDEYMALTVTLKYELPKLSILTTKAVVMCLTRLVYIQADWYNLWTEKMKVVLEESQIPKDLADIVNIFNRDHNKGLLKEADSLAILNGSFLVGNRGMSTSTLSVSTPGEDEQTFSPGPQISQTGHSQSSHNPIRKEVGISSAEDHDRSSDYKVLYIAASLYDFAIEATKSVDGYPYLFYGAGEVFDIFGEKGELWLAKNQDDPSGVIGWVWSKHFARLAV